MVNKIYQVEESAITWRHSGGTEVLNLSALAAGAGRQGELHNFNFTAAAGARLYNWRAFVEYSATTVAGEFMEVYWKTSDGTNADNDLGISDAAMSAGQVDKLRNLKPLGVIFSDENSPTKTYVGSGVLLVEHVFGAPVFWNASSDALGTTPANHGFDLRPIPPEIQ